MLQGSMIKYLSDKGGADHNGTLAWPGTIEGFPVRGDVTNLRGQDPSNVAHTFDFHSRRFELWKPEDHTAFNDIMDRIHNGWYCERRRVDRWCDENKGMVVWLEWLQIYGVIVPAK